MTDEIAALLADARTRVTAAADGAALDALRVEWLGKKGRVTELMKTLGTMPADQRKARGAALNAVKDEVAALIEARGAGLAEAELDARLARERIDVTLPPRPLPAGPPSPPRATAPSRGRARRSSPRCPPTRRRRGRAQATC